MKIPIEYIFFDKEGGLRSKSKVLSFSPTSIQDIPSLYSYPDQPPVALYDDPFRPPYGKLVLCQHPSRPHCKLIMEYYQHLEPWFGMEQEYVLFDPSTNKPLGWPKHGEPESQVNNIYIYVCVFTKANPTICYKIG